MAQSVQYVYWSQSSVAVRLEIIQVDNGANHVNVSCNFQVGPEQWHIGDLWGDCQSFDGKGYSGTLTAGSTSINFSGGNGNYPVGQTPLGYKSIATQWIGTIPRSAGTFSIVWRTIWDDTDYHSHQQCIVETGPISIMAYVPPNAVDTLSNYSSATLGTAVTFTITNSTAYAHTDTLTYSIGSASGNVQASISVPANSTKTVTWTPPTSLGAQIPSAFTGVCVLTLTTTGVSGSRTYNCTLTVPSYTYTLSSPTVAKTTYTGIGGSTYVAGKHTAKWTAPTFPTAQYGATITAMFYAAYGGDSQPVYSTSITSGGNASYTGERAGTLTGTIVITDSRGVTKSAYRSVTYVANPSVSITSFSALRSGQTTTVNYSATGRYDSTLSGNTGTLAIIRDNAQIDSASGSSGTASVSGTATQLTTESEVYTCTMTDALGNQATKKITVSTAFFYIQVGGGDNGKGVSIGRAASTTGTDSLEIGLPTIIDGETRVNRYFPYMEEDADGNTMLSAWDVFLPRVTRSMLGLPDNTVSAGLEAYLKWVVKNVYSGNTRTRGLFTCGSLYAVDVEVYSKTVDANGTPQYSAGIAYTYGKTNAMYRFGTNNYAFYYHQLDIIGQFMVYKPYLYTDTNNVNHAQDTVIHAPHVGYADLGLASTNTLAEGFKALIDWLKTNYASNANVAKSRCVVHGTFSGRSSGSTERNMMYQVIFYDISQAEAGGTAPRYCTGWAMAMDSLKIFTFRNYNGTMTVHEHVGTAVTA